MLNLEVFVGRMPNALLREPPPQRDFVFMVSDVPMPGSYITRQKQFYRVDAVLYKDAQIGQGPQLFVSRAYV